MYNYGIGGQEVKLETSEAISEIAQNRTLFIQKLTADAPFRPQIVEGLKTVDEVFDYFKPEQDVEFTTEDGASVSEKLQFKGVGDFTAKNITQQSKFLQSLDGQAKDYQQLLKQLKSNKILKAMLENPDAKAAYLQALQALIQELEDAE
ncbi:MAG: hypothetical protein MUC97_09065 [Bernardetiaceae bacterium]|jgi:hypothetical protein|nr:hypothetical protein [Bernardetiaceae bacterium]